MGEADDDTSREDPPRSRERVRASASVFTADTLLSAAVGAPIPPTLVAGADERDEDAGARAIPARYALRARLGEGGMGTVDLCIDTRIGREVALKRIGESLAGSGELRARFLREARVQGQLEHPAVVPVHDLDEDADGAAYFTMKRVRGASLDDVIARLRAGEPDASARFGRRKLLSAFATVCLAVDFAHSRGVLHRDLKPGNVMLGDFGEVYVLDWGLAKLLREPASDGAPTDAEQPPAPVDAESIPGATRVGAMMGTPGYMSPEQAMGELAALDARTDVYALGAILFELLHLEPLNAGESVTERLDATLRGAGSDAARARSADVPPELDALWREAVAVEREARLGSARALAERIERYLDGERDEARRRELASEHVARARGFDVSDPEARAEAMRALGHALALDPTHEEALRALSRLLTDLPEEVPAGARLAIARARAEERVQMARTSAIRLATWLAVVPAVIAFGVIDWTRGAAVLVSLSIAALAALLAWRTRATSDAALATLVGLSTLAIGLVSFVFGPFVLVPSLAATNAMFFAMSTDRRARRAVLAASVGALVVPWLATVLGLEAPYYRFGPEGLTIVSPMVALPEALVMPFLLVVSVALVVTPTILAGRMRDALARAEERLLVSSHYLAQLVPEAARGAERSAVAEEAADVRPSAP
ncbi:MAG: serine/threonine protein kinase [Sandaracinaceae bacterium]|nr:serine/threonine protein kinase [Sandaracinaceae bacterium]